MTWDQLIRTVALQAGATIVDTRKLLEIAFDVIAQEARSGKRVNIPNLGPSPCGRTRPGGSATPRQTRS